MSLFVYKLKHIVQTKDKVFVKSVEQGLPLLCSVSVGNFFDVSWKEWTERVGNTDINYAEIYIVLGVRFPKVISCQ